MKVVIASWILLAGTTLAGGLKFSETSKKVPVEASAKSVSVDFKFTNDSKKSVSIVKTDGGCSCIAVKVAGGKTIYGPGESGVMRAIFDIGTFTGEVERPVKVWIKGDDVDTPTQTLNILVDIPALVTLEPKTLLWTAGEEATPKKMVVKMHDKTPIHIESIDLPSEIFATSLEAIKEGEEYEITITPTSTANPGVVGALHIKTDSGNDRYSNIQAFAAIQRKP